MDGLVKPPDDYGTEEKPAHIYLSSVFKIILCSEHLGFDVQGVCAHSPVKMLGLPCLGVASEMEFSWSRCLFKFR